MRITRKAKHRTDHPTKQVGEWRLTAKGLREKDWSCERTGKNDFRIHLSGRTDGSSTWNYHIEFTDDELWQLLKTALAAKATS